MVNISHLISSRSEILDLHSLSFMSDEKNVKLANLLSKEILDEIVLASDNLIFTLSEYLVDQIQMVFNVKHLLVGRPVLLSNLRPERYLCEN